MVFPVTDMQGFCDCCHKQYHLQDLYDVTRQGILYLYCEDCYEGKNGTDCLCNKKECNELIQEKCLVCEETQLDCECE